MKRLLFLVASVLPCVLLFCVSARAEERPKANAQSAPIVTKEMVKQIEYDCFGRRRRHAEMMGMLAKMHAEQRVQTEILRQIALNNQLAAAHGWERDPARVPTIPFERNPANVPTIPFETDPAKVPTVPFEADPPKVQAVPFESDPAKVPILSSRHRFYYAQNKKPVTQGGSVQYRSPNTMR